MTDVNVLKYWKKRMDSELKGDEQSEVREYQLRKGALLQQIYELIGQYNELDKKETYVKWFWWWRYNLAKRVLNKFKINNIYRDKRATEYWKKLYMNKTCKMKNKGLEYAGKGKLLGLINSLAALDLDNLDKYVYVSKKIKECGEKTNC